ncbi:MAG TPA: two-component regulator propeller domain-containing protein [Leadbetterella sp.]|nr:two-component regulator propeller domain-containing protein [Leadbetterella sp.]
MKKLVILFALLTMSVSGIICNGQEKLIKNLGLSNDKGNNVHCSLEDKAGNLWFGTTGDGLFKYDPSASLRTGGKTFTQFTTSNGLNHNLVNDILEDKAGNVWIGTEAGLMLYDPLATVKTGGKSFTEIKIPFRKNVPSKRNDVWSIMQDKSGKLWFATFDGVYTYDPARRSDSNNLKPDGKSFNFFKVTDDTTDCIFKTEYILEDKAGNVWFGGRCNVGVYRYDPSASLSSGGKTITHLKPNGDDWAWPVLQDKKGNIWFSSWKGAYRYDPSASLRTGSELFEKVEGLSDGPITRIIEDKKENLWFGGGGRGLCRYDPSAPLNAGGKTFTCFTAKDGLINDDVWSILEDRTGVLWVGTRETILHRFDGKTFTSYTE